MGDWVEEVRTGAEHRHSLSALEFPTVPPMVADPIPLTSPSSRKRELGRAQELRTPDITAKGMQKYTNQTVHHHLPLGCQIQLPRAPSVSDSFYI